MNKQKILQDFLRKAQQNGNKEEPRKGEEVFDMGGVQIVVPKAKDGYSPIKGKDFFTPQEVEQFKKDVTPVYKKDYLKPDELESIAQQILVHATPQKGIHYEDGKDGISPDPNDIAESVLERIPAPDLDAIASIAVTKIPIPKDGKDGKDANPKVVIDAIKKLKGNDRLDISNIRNGEQITQALAGVSTLGKKINTLDERWHGGGGSSILLETNGTKNSSQALLNLVAGTNITLSETGGAVTIAASGGSSLTLTTTGTTGASTYSGGTLNIPVYQGALTLTTSGTSGAATLSGNTLNIPQYAGTTYTFTSPLVNTSGTITINQATTSTNGYLSSTDWNTFNNKQGAITLTTTGSSGAATFSGNTLNIPNYSSALSGYIKTDGSSTGATSQAQTFTNGVILSNLNSGYIPYANGSAKLINSPLYTDGTNVGIGTTSPNIGGAGNINLAVQGPSGHTAQIAAYSSDSLSSVTLYSGVSASDSPAIIYQNTLRFGAATGLGTTGYNQVMVLTPAGYLGIGTSSPTAVLHLKAGTATAGTSPFKLTSGTNLTVVEDGAMEYNGTHLYFSIGSTRYQLDQQSSGSSGITRSISSISTATTAGATASTDYVYSVSGTTTLTLPTAVGNTNLYTVIRTDASLVTTIATSASQTINGASTYTLNSQYESIGLISNGSNWLIV